MIEDKKTNRVISTWCSVLTILDLTLAVLGLCSILRSYVGALLASGQVPGATGAGIFTHCHPSPHPDTEDPQQLLD